MITGLLRHKITIQQLRVKKGDYGEEVKTWAKFTDAWASIEPIRGDEMWASKQVQAQVSHRIRIRYIEGVTPGMEIVHRDRRFEIEAVLNWREKDRVLEIMAKERVEV